MFQLSRFRSKYTAHITLILAAGLCLFLSVLILRDFDMIMITCSTVHRHDSVDSVALIDSVSLFSEGVVRLIKTSKY